MRLQRTKKTSFEGRHATPVIDVAKSSPPDATKIQTRSGVKEEIRDAIDAADRSMSKCYATLRRLRSKLKN